MVVLSAIFILMSQNITRIWEVGKGEEVNGGKNARLTWNKMRVKSRNKASHLLYTYYISTSELFFFRSKIFRNYCYYLAVARFAYWCHTIALFTPVTKMWYAKISDPTQLYFPDEFSLRFILHINSAQTLVDIYVSLFLRYGIWWMSALNVASQAYG